MRDNITKQALEDIMKLPIEEVERQLRSFEGDEPEIYRQSIDLRDGALEWHNTLLYRIMVDEPDFTHEHQARIHLACAKSLKGEINLTGYLQ